MATDWTLCLNGKAQMCMEPFQMDATRATLECDGPKKDESIDERDIKKCNSIAMGVSGLSSVRKAGKMKREDMEIVETAKPEELVEFTRKQETKFHNYAKTEIARDEEIYVTADVTKSIN